MMFRLALVFLGDFQYSAPPGHWLDYARCGPLSANRFLVVEHVGTKGQHNLGAAQKVLDASRDLLYDIPVAENAWMVRKGCLETKMSICTKTEGNSSLFYGDPGKTPWRLLSNLIELRYGFSADSVRWDAGGLLRRIGRGSRCV